MNELKTKIKSVAARVYPALFLFAVFMMVGGDFPRFPFGITERKWILLVFSWPKLYIVLFCLSFLLILFSNRIQLNFAPMAPFQKPILILSISFLVSSLFAQNIYLGITAYLYYMGILLFLLLFFIALSDRTIHSYMRQTVTWAILFLSLRVILWRIQEGLEIGTYHIGNNAWLGKLQIALILNLFTPFFLSRFLSCTEKRTVVVNGMAWLLSGLAIVTLYARAGMAIYVLTTIVYCALLKQHWKRSAGIILLLLIALAPLYGKSSRMLYYVANTLTHFKSDVGLTKRSGIWKETLLMFRDHPYTGIGLGNYDDAAYIQYHTKYDDQGIIKNKFFRSGWHAHNLLLHVLAETGLIGFLAWLYLWYTILSVFSAHALRQPAEFLPESLAPLFTILIYFVLSLTEHLMAVRVHESFRMNCTLYLLLIIYYRHGFIRPSETI